MFSRLYGVLLPFFAAFLLAYLLDPFVDFVQNKCKVKIRGLAVTIVLLLFTGALTLALYLLIPAIGHEVRLAAIGVEQYIASIDLDKFLSVEQQQKFDEMVERMNIEGILSDPEAREALKSIAPHIGGWITGGLSWLAELFVVVIALMYLVFLMVAFPRIRANWINFVPFKYRSKARTLMHEANRNMNAYFRGQGMVAFIVGILFAIGFSIIGMPMGIAMGLIIGVLNFVPYMQALGIPPCILLCLVQSAQTGRPVWVTLLCLAIVFVVVQTLQDMVLVPKIMGKVTGMSPAAILLSLSIWGAIFGVIGMIIALPMTTLIMSYYQHYIKHSNNIKPVES